ncbi:MAG TPA: TetR/AcrR family transcriptional regulator [Fimbriimonadaceae bacterium]|nr:TetR/AcrR family transcriptional regulator [Fimbriimonadaceae bacterium]
MAAAPELAPTADAILDAADRVIGRHGLRKATMDDVAAEAGVSRRTVYDYFANKQDLALASIDRVVKRAHARISVEADSAEPAAERLYRMLVARVKVRIESVRDISQSLDSMFSVIRAAYMQRRKQYFEEEAAMLAEVIKDGQAAGTFARLDPLETARLFVEATNAYLPYSLSLEELQSPGNLEDRVTKMATILVAGILR